MWVDLFDETTLAAIHRKHRFAFCRIIGDNFGIIKVSIMYRSERTLFVRVFNGNLALPHHNLCSFRLRVNDSHGYALRHSEGGGTASFNRYFIGSWRKIQPDDGIGSHSDFADSA